MKIQLSSRSRSQLYRMIHGGIPLATIPGGEIWTHPRHGLVRIARKDIFAAREGRRVETLPLTRTAASIAAARLKAAGMTGQCYEELRAIAAKSHLPVFPRCPLVAAAGMLWE